MRRATLGDVAPVREVLDDCTTTYLGRASSEDDARARLREGRGPPDTAIAFLAGEPIAFGHVWRASRAEVRMFLRVRPAWRGRGAASALLATLEAAAHQIARDSVTLSATNWAGDDAGALFLASQGFEPERHFLQMRVELAMKATPPSPPAGVVVRDFKPGEDDDAVFATFRDSFGDHWGNQNPDREIWWRENRDDSAAGFDPWLWLIAESGGEMCGFLVGRERDEAVGAVGWVSLVGVIPAERGRGIGECLLRSAFVRFGARGLREAGLNVDVENTTSALRLYEKVGMRRRPAFTAWRKHLTLLPG